MEKPSPNNPPVAPYMPPTIKFNEPLNGTDNEIDFSTIKYFMLFGNKKGFLGDEEVMRLVLTSRVDNQPLFTHLMMTREGGVAHVAHLPNITDMKQRVDLVGLKERLLSIIEDEPGVPPAQSRFYLGLVDPAPMLDFAWPSHPLQLGTFIAEIGTYTDAFQVLTLACKMSSIGIVVSHGAEAIDPTDTFTRVIFTPMNVAGVGELPSEGRIVIWNCRGFGRSSLQANLARICEDFKPFLVILTESKITKPNFRHIFNELNVDMEWEVDDSFSISGGVIVLWDKTKADVDLMYSPQGADLRLLGDIRAPVQSDESDEDSDSN